MSWQGWLIPGILVTKHKSRPGPNQSKNRTHEQYTTKMSTANCPWWIYDFSMLQFNIKFILINWTLKRYMHVWQTEWLVHTEQTGWAEAFHTDVTAKAGSAPHGTSDATKDWKRCWMREIAQFSYAKNRCPCFSKQISWLDFD